MPLISGASFPHALTGGSTLAPGTPHKKEYFGYKEIPSIA